MKALLLAVSIPLLLISSSAMTCDDKACEVAYLASTQQYVANFGRQALTERIEREAHAKNRERRDYAVVKHLQRVNKYLSRH
ncbi:MAG TPA: hypothetical protein EYH38_00835 [Leucothrix sp.]|nr:hypothetical protein [Leucothrix sp.]HIQ14104.1 hypothetical protein [Leucothrix sp.]